MWFCQRKEAVCECKQRAQRFHAMPSHTKPSEQMCIENMESWRMTETENYDRTDINAQRKSAKMEIQIYYVLKWSVIVNNVGVILHLNLF